MVRARREQRLHLGAEEQRVADDSVVEGLDAQAIPDEDELAKPIVPHGECEHPVEMVHAAIAPLLPCVDDDLRVADGVETVTALLQLGASPPTGPCTPATSDT